MNKILLLFLGVTLLLGPLAALGQQEINGSIQLDDEERTYILYLPENYEPSESYPLLLNFHGLGSSAWEQMWYGDFRPIADTAGFIIVHPQGLPNASGQNHFNVGFTGDGSLSDVHFTDALLDSLIADYLIDENRIYSTGMSNGGYMSYFLACQLSHRITAVASVTGSMTPVVLEGCDPQHPMPVMQMHGTADLVVPYDGAAWTLSMDDLMAYWAGVNNCSDPSSTVLPDIDMTDGGLATHNIYDDGDNGAKVEFFSLENSSHAWPGNFLGQEGVNYDIIGSVEIWKFFSRYDLNSLTQPIISSDGSDESLKPQDWSITALPGQLQINNMPQTAKYYSIWTMQGQLIQSGSIDADRRIPLSIKENGMYIIEIEGTSRSFNYIKE